MSFLVCRIGWAPNYKGEELQGDGGGSYVVQHGEGDEKFNFLPYNGKVYGYVASKTRTIDCSKLIGPPRPNTIQRISYYRSVARKPDRADGVTVIWCAKHPKYGGVYVIGWYCNATVYRELHDPPEDLTNRRLTNGDEWAYNIVTDKFKLLPPDQRKLRVPCCGEGNMGRSNIWYPSEAFKKAFKTLYLLN